VLIGFTNQLAVVACCCYCFAVADYARKIQELESQLQEARVHAQDQSEQIERLKRVTVDSTPQFALLSPAINGQHLPLLTATPSIATPAQLRTPSSVSQRQQQQHQQQQQQQSSLLLTPEAQPYSPTFSASGSAYSYRQTENVELIKWRLQQQFQSQIEALQEQHVLV
jgi:hypothetical protein